MATLFLSTCGNYSGIKELTLSEIVRVMDKAVTCKEHGKSLLPDLQVLSLSLSLSLSLFFFFRLEL